MPLSPVKRLVHSEMGHSSSFGLILMSGDVGGESSAGMVSAVIRRGRICTVGTVGTEDVVLLIISKLVACCLAADVPV